MLPQPPRDASDPGDPGGDPAPRPRAAEPGDAAAACVALAYRPPLDWDWMLAFLRLRSIGAVEAAGDARAYRRTLRVADARGTAHRGWLEIRADSGRARRAPLSLRLSAGLLPVTGAVLARVRHALDLDCRPRQVAAALGELARGREGLRLPQGFDGFEVAVRAILGQQISVKAAHTLAGRIARRHGEPIDTPFAGIDRVFPAPATIAAVDAAELAALGIPRARAATIVALARAIRDGALSLEPGAEVGETIATLKSFAGIGDWTAQYLAMRALGWSDAFPASDLGVMKALRVATPRAAELAAERWRPWRAYAVMHLWTPPPATAPRAPA